MSKFEDSLRDKKIYLNKHKSAQDLVLSYYHKTYSKIKDKREFFSQRSKIHNGKISIKESIKKIKEKGIWGYCEIDLNSDYKEIHYWVDKSKVKLCDIAELLSHEVAHIIGIKSEHYAIKYSYVASVVIQFLMKDFILK